MSEVYVLHFDKPYWMNCTHYAGRTKLTAEKRAELHRSGNGSKLVAYAIKKGCTFTIAHVEKLPTNQAARARELAIKQSGHIKHYCEICNPRIKAAAHE